MNTSHREKTFPWIEVKPGVMECRIGPWLLRAQKQVWPSGPNLFSCHMWWNGKPAGSSGYNLPSLEAAEQGAEYTYTLRNPT